MYYRVGLAEAPVQSSDVYEEMAAYVYNVTLSANQELLDQAIVVDSDSDFQWRKIAGSKTGEYELRIRLPNGRYLSNLRIRAANLVGTAQFPVPVWPPVRVPAGGRIGVDLKDLSGASNSIQIVLMGVRQFPKR